MRDTVRIQAGIDLSQWFEICNDGTGISEPGLRKARKVNNLGTVLHLQGKDAARKYATSLQAFFLLNVPTGGTRFRASTMFGARFMVEESSKWAEVTPGPVARSNGLSFFCAHGWEVEPPIASSGRFS